MIFNSWTFLIFFAVVVVAHHLPLSWRAKKFNLVMASYLFYAAWNPPFVMLLWFSTFVDWFSARVIDRSRTRKSRVALMILSLAANLGVLGYFKYGEFLLENFVVLMNSFGIDYQPAAPSIVLPVGISFYTFHSLSYTIDVYRRTIRPWTSFLDFALYVAFFPALVAGPILRANDFLPQCLTERRASAGQLGWGLVLLVFGLFEKVVLADGFLAPVADTVYGAAGSAGFIDAWVGTLAFSGQIFCDFDGYSHCAIGAALCLGFAIPDNFRFPYAAIGFSDFWRRWHISLSTWLRDYLYITLGGNRRGTVRTYINLMLTMLIGGLWHGAAWRFVVWGGLHGIYLVGERLVRRALGQSESGIGGGAVHWTGGVGLALLTYLLVCLTWVFFRAGSFGEALDILTAMFVGGGSGLGLGAYEIGTVLLITVLLLSAQWLLRDSAIEAAVGRFPGWLRVAVLAALLTAIAIAPGDERAFIYFQF